MNNPYLGKGVATIIKIQDDTPWWFCKASENVGLKRVFAGDSVPEECPYILEHAVKVDK
jgi:hypothetical protein